MSESYEPKSDSTGSPMPRPNGEGLPPKTGGELRRPGADDSVDPGMPGEGGDRGQDTGGQKEGGMAGEG